MLAVKLVMYEFERFFNKRICNVFHVYDKSNYFIDLVRNRSKNCKVRDKGVPVYTLMAYG
jgi:hypothetical protein